MNITLLVALLAYNPYSSHPQMPQQISDMRSMIEIVQQHKNSPNKVPPADNVRPGAAQKMVFGYPDCSYDYRCYCENRFRYHTSEITASRAQYIREEVKRLAQSPMFGCYTTEPDIKGRMETRCRFVRSVELSKNDPAFTGIDLRADLGATTIVWIESAVRVDAKGLPLEDAESLASPILLESNGHSYEVFQDYGPSQSHCLMTVLFDGQVFDLSRCNNHVDCLQHVLDTYTFAIRDQFSRDPISALEIHDQPVPPGDTWMRREFQPSRILGPPYFELTTYVMKLWFANSNHATRFSVTPREGLDNLYLSASQSFTRSVGVAGTYTEPSPEQLAAYRLATNAALNRALASACTILHGHLADHLCLL